MARSSRDHSSSSSLSSSSRFSIGSSVEQSLNFSSARSSSRRSFLLGENSLLSFRRQSLNIQTQAAPQTTDYADLHPVKTNFESEMHTTHDDERTPRKSRKSENRLFGFLTRSRSRSRSKDDTEHPPEPADLSIMPLTKTTTPTKPKNISSSRPLSSTTNTTVGPPTPKPNKRIPSSIPVATKTMPDVLSQQHDITPTSRPTTPKGASTTRRKLHALFGLPLSRKSSVSSRPSSPGHSDPPPSDVPASPPPKQPVVKRRTISDPDNPAPKLWTARIPTPPSHTPRSQSPKIVDSKPSPKTTESDLSASTTSSAASSSRLEQRHSKVSSGSGIRVSHPRPKASVASNTLTDTGHPPLGRPTSGSPIVNQKHLPPSGSALSNIPGSPHTRARTSSLSKESPPAIPHVNLSPRMTRRKDSMDSTHRYRPMTIVSEEKDTDELASDDTPAATRTRESLKMSKADSHFPFMSKRSSGIRETKHGSFDFERPGWSNSIVRSTSHGSTSTGGPPSSYGKDASRESLDRPRGSLQKSLSLNTKPDRRPRTSNRAASPEPQPKASGSGGILSSSLGRSTVKKGFGSGIARLVGVHGPFAFEPAVISSPTRKSELSRSTGSAPNRHDTERNRTLERERKDRQKLRDLEKQREAEEEKERREKERRRAARRTAQIFDPVPDDKPTTAINGQRAATKGRSLDLGLGLAWAPRKIKEEYLLPSSTFALEKGFGAKNGVARNNDRSIVGKDVADSFRNALDEDGYAAFKRYVHRFDAHEIPFDGPSGIISRAERLLDGHSCRQLTSDSKRRLLDNLVRIILQNA